MRRRRAIVTFLQQRPATARQMAAALTITVDQVNTAVWQLRKAGGVVTLGDVPSDRTAYGRARETLYGPAPATNPALVAGRR